MRRAVRGDDRIDRQGEFAALEKLLEQGLGILAKRQRVDACQYRFVETLDELLRGAEAASIYDIEAGDCCLAPLPRKRNGYVLTFLNDMSREMLAFLYHSGMCIQRNQN